MHVLTSAILFLVLFCLPEIIAAQQEKKWLKNEIMQLASPTMAGRGYVEKGVDKASNHISKLFQTFGLRSFQKDSSFIQHFNMSVNTFPNAAYLKLQRKEMNPGEEYIVHAASSKIATEKMKVKTIDLHNVKDSAAWKKVSLILQPKFAYRFTNLDTAIKYVHQSQRNFSRQLPKGVYIIPQHGKLTWTVATDSFASAIFYVEDTVMPKRIRKMAARLDNKFIPKFKSQNVIGYVPGTKYRDSFIVFTAHFDHLGKMGRQTLFPGAHDNASGTALMMYLAQYFAKNPQSCSMAFMAFSGEEAGLLGSKYYTEHPLFPLQKIRFVVNLDMTGDATDGITVVNATEQKKAFELLQKINHEKQLLPKITERGQTKNSDHYHFSKNGVPAIFIYGNGTKPYYHDVFDKAKEISLENIDGLIVLLQQFVEHLQ